MPKKIIWKRTIVRVESLENYLNQHNFQPGKFFVVTHPTGFTVDVFFVESEV